MKEILVPVFKNGQCVYESPSVNGDPGLTVPGNWNTLWEETRRLVNPQSVYVDLSDRLYEIKSGLLHQFQI